MAFPPSDPRGSFRFPDPEAFNGTLEEFHQFFSSQPIDDETLARVNKSYKSARNKDYNRLHDEGVEAFENDDAVVAWFRAASPAEVEAELHTRKMDYARDYATERLNESWPGGPTISPLKTRIYARVFQMVRLRGILRNDELKERLLEMPVPQSEDDVTFKELAMRYRLSKWSENAFDQ